MALWCGRKFTLALGVPVLQDTSSSSEYLESHTSQSQ